ncbi:MAG: hypothetical protein WCK17_10995 [Verrucomicrobiota bacterium]
MSTSTWSNNELAVTYDEKFAVLEAARSEYDRAVKALLDDIAEEVKQREQAGGADNEVLSSSCSQAGGFGKWSLDYIVPGFGEAKTRVMVRFSSPWAGLPGFLHIVVASISDDERIIGNLRRLAQSSIRLEQRRGAYVGVKTWESNWIWAESVSLSDPSVVASATDTLGLLMGLARDAARHIEFRMEWLLNKCRQQLENNCKLIPFVNRKISRVRKDWQKQVYLQLNLSENLPGFWVGYEWDRESLMFGNNPTSLDNEFQNALREKLSLVSFEKYGGLPGGTLMDSEGLRNTHDENVLGVMILAFETYIQAMTVSTKPV